ncbi:MAG: adenylate/guanylate cyclase domain-containing protein [Phototrophicales bacterium]|nr:adenylate/guanylate cyclase domain-containing protein [Phototrophicales bacterium]
MTTILVVDDTEVNLTLIENLLTYSGYTILTARDGQDALTIMQQQTIQLLIVDWMMPRMDGIELIRAIRAQFPEPYRYIIMLTGRQERDAVVTGLGAGADDFVTRPFNSRELEARVAIGVRIIELENRMRDLVLVTERSKQIWEATTDSIVQLICLVDRDGLVLRSNGVVENWRLSSMYEAAGLSLSKLMGKVYKDAGKKLADAWDVAKEKLAHGLEYDFECRDDQLGYYFDVHYQPINPFGGLFEQEEAFAAVSIQDITERKQLELNLQQANAQLAIERDKSDDVLVNMLPRPIAERLKSGEKTIAEYHENTTVMFADLVGFTPLTAALAPRQLMEILNTVFSTFDVLTQRHGTEKIKTIGDSYMVVAGIPNPLPDHAQSIAKLALAMIRIMKSLSEHIGIVLELRIGIDSGHVVAGVIGSVKFSYDLWGDVVNTASRMESTGQGGKIQVTEAVYHLLKDQFKLEKRGLVDVKGKGKILTYWLVADLG